MQFIAICNIWGAFHLVWASLTYCFNVCSDAAFCYSFFLRQVSYWAIIPINNTAYNPDVPDMALTFLKIFDKFTI
jgi:hypothetical protein